MSIHQGSRLDCLQGMSGFWTMYKVFVGRKDKNTDPRTSAEGLAAQVFLRTHEFCTWVVAKLRFCTSARTLLAGGRARIEVTTESEPSNLLNCLRTQSEIHTQYNTFTCSSSQIQDFFFRPGPLFFRAHSVSTSKAYSVSRIPGVDNKHS